MAGLKQRLVNILTAFDQLIYVLITLGYGYPDETLSSAAYRAERDRKFFGFFRPVIDFLFLPIERNHCYQAYLAERNRLQIPKEIRGK